MGTNTRPHYCPFCGANLKKEDYFCRHCGKKIPDHICIETRKVDLSMTHQSVSNGKFFSSLSEKWIFILVCLVGIIIISIAAYFKINPHNKPIPVVVDTMANDFIKNADKADDKYANKNLELSGKVISRVKTDDSYYACLSQKTTYGKTYIVVSEIPIDHPEWIKKFQEGQRVKFIGTLLGMKKSDKDKNLYIIVVDIKSVK